MYSGAHPFGTAVTSVQLDAVSLFGAVDGRLLVLRFPLAAVGGGDVPAPTPLALVQSVQPRALVVLFAVADTQSLHVQGGAGLVNDVATPFQLHVRTIAPDTSHPKGLRQPVNMHLDDTGAIIHTLFDFAS